MADFITVFIYIYLPWILVTIFGLTWIIFAFLAPREVWAAWKIKNTPGMVGFLLFDDAGQGTIKGMRNEADKGVFVTKKDEYQIVPTSPPVEGEPKQYEYRYVEGWTEAQKEEHTRLVDEANAKLVEQVHAKQVLGETIKKRTVLFNKPCYIGISTIGMGASPHMLELMQDSVEAAENRKNQKNKEKVNLIGVDVLKQVLTLTYPPARIMSIGKRHENRIRKGAFNIPLWAIILFAVIGIVVILVATGIVDVEAIGKMVMGVGKK